jgi:hypothetical protein
VLHLTKVSDICSGMHCGTCCCGPDTGFHGVETERSAKVLTKEDALFYQNVGLPYERNSFACSLPYVLTFSEANTSVSPRCCCPRYPCTTNLGMMSYLISSITNLCMRKKRYNIDVTSLFFV